jgi:hypothetical protein
MTEVAAVAHVCDRWRRRRVESRGRPRRPGTASARARPGGGVLLGELTEPAAAKLIMRESSFDEPDTMPPEKQRRADPCLMAMVLTPHIWDGQPRRHRYDARPHGHGHWGHAKFRAWPRTVPPGSAGTGGSTMATSPLRPPWSCRSGEHGVALGDTLAENFADGVIRPDPGPQRAQASRRMQPGIETVPGARVVGP